SHRPHTTDFRLILRSNLLDTLDIGAFDHIPVGEPEDKISPAWRDKYRQSLRMLPRHKRLKIIAIRNLPPSWGFRKHHSKAGIEKMSENTPSEGSLYSAIQADLSAAWNI